MIRYQLLVVQVFLFCWLVLPCRERNKLKACCTTVLNKFTNFQPTKLSPFQNLLKYSSNFTNFTNFSLDILVTFIVI